MTGETKTVLVTGGSGMVGYAIQAVINETKPKNENWVFASSKDANLMSTEETQALFDLHKPTHVIHLAAKVGGLFENMRSNCDFFRFNMRMNDNVQEACKKFKVQKLVACLSTCIFPNKVTYPIDETKLHLGPPHDSNFGFSYAKRIIDISNKAYNSQYGCQFTSVIPTNVFGPNDNFSIEEGHVFGGLIHKTAIAKKEKKDLVIWGSGKPLRQFIFSMDLAKLIIWTMREYKEIDPIILSVDEKDEISIRDLASKIAAAFNFEGNIVYDTSKSDGQFKKTASTDKLRGYLPDFEFTPIEKAIDSTVQWFEKNYETARK